MTGRGTMTIEPAAERNARCMLAVVFEQRAHDCRCARTCQRSNREGVRK